MSLSIEIQKKPDIEKQRKVCTSEEVFKLEEVQEIKDAVQEHLLFIGLDTKNNIRNISLLAVGKSNLIEVDLKSIVRTALITASDKVILVHNHPSNEVEPSIHDKDITDVINKLLKAYDIEFLDHIIVGKDKYLSMGKENLISKEYVTDRGEFTKETLLMEEIYKLKEKIHKLTNELQQYKKVELEEEEQFE